MDGALLRDFVGALRRTEIYSNIHSLLIVRHGVLVVEEYFSGWSRDDLHELQSVSKSVTSALIGIATRRGDIDSLSHRVVEYFPDYHIENLDEHKRSMTLGDLLTMRSGTDYHEGYDGSPHAELNKLSRGWDCFVLNRPMINTPGTRFRYDSGGVILLSAILERETGMHADAYAERFLFPRIGIEKWRWLKNAEGHPHTGGGLDLRPRDLARIGLLYLRDGRWESEQILDPQWVQASLEKQVSLSDHGRRTVGYGYLWWIQEPPPGGKKPIVSARGFKGQHLFLIPDHDMAVVTTAGELGSSMHAPVNLLYTHLLPAVLDSHDVQR